MRVRKPEARALVKVPGRGIALNASTRRVPHKHRDNRRPKTKQLLQEG